MENSIYEHARLNGILISKGNWFGATAKSTRFHIRLTFAAAPESTLETAVRPFADTVRAVLPTQSYQGNVGSPVSEAIKNGCSERFSQNAGS